MSRHASLMPCLQNQWSIINPRISGKEAIHNIMQWTEQADMKLGTVGMCLFGRESCVFFNLTYIPSAWNCESRVLWIGVGLMRKMVRRPMEDTIRTSQLPYNEESKKCWKLYKVTLGFLHEWLPCIRIYTNGAICVHLNRFPICIEGLFIQMKHATTNIVWGSVLENAISLDGWPKNHPEKEQTLFVRKIQHRTSGRINTS